ncbi:hypothetical protein ABVT39_001833 [Epinephelus coioides]
MHSLSVAEEELQDSPDEEAVNDLRNSTYRRYYNKKLKCWSVYTLKEKKNYSYIVDLQRVGAWCLGLLAAQPPPPTAELVRTHVQQQHSA